MPYASPPPPAHPPTCSLRVVRRGATVRRDCMVGSPAWMMPSRGGCSCCCCCCSCCGSRLLCGSRKGPVCLLAIASAGVARPCTPPPSGVHSSTSCLTVVLRGKPAAPFSGSLSASSRARERQAEDTPSAAAASAATCCSGLEAMPAFDQPSTFRPPKLRARRSRKPPGPCVR
jgi:hypothetical protein